MSQTTAYLKVISIIAVVLIHLLGEERDGVADEEVCHVHRQGMVDAAFTQPPVDRRVVHYWNVVIPIWKTNIYFYYK